MLRVGTIIITISFIFFFISSAMAQDIRWKVTVEDVPLYLSIYSNKSIMDFKLSRKAIALSWDELDRLIGIALGEVAGPTCGFESDSVRRASKSISGKVACSE